MGNECSIARSLHLTSNSTTMKKIKVYFSQLYNEQRQNALMQIVAFENEGKQKEDMIGVIYLEFRFSDENPDAYYEFWINENDTENVEVKKK